MDVSPAENSRDQPKKVFRARAVGPARSAPSMPNALESLMPTLQAATAAELPALLLRALAVPGERKPDEIPALSDAQAAAIKERLENLYSPFYQSYLRARLGGNSAEALRELGEGYSTQQRVDLSRRLHLEREDLGPEFAAELDPKLLQSEITLDVALEAQSQATVEWRFDPRSGCWNVRAVNSLTAFAEIPLKDPELAAKLPAASFWQRVRAIQIDRELSDKELALVLGLRPSELLVQIENDCDSPKKSAQIVPLLARRLQVSPYRLLGVADLDEVIALPWNEQIRVRRQRLGLTLRATVEAMRLLDKGFESARPEPMLVQLQRYEKGDFAPPGDSQRVLSMILEVSKDIFPSPKRATTGIHRKVEQVVISRVANFIEKADISPTGMPLDADPVEIEATPGNSKRLGKFSLYIPELAGADCRTFLLIAREYPLLGQALAIYPRREHESVDECVAGLPHSVIVAQQDGPRTVRLPFYYVLQALKGLEVPLEMALCRVRLATQSESLLRVQIDAGIESRVLTLDARQSRERGFSEGAVVELRAVKTESGTMVVVEGIRPLGLDSATEERVFLAAFRPHELRLKGRGASHPIVQPRSGPLPTLDVYWRTRLSAAQANPLSSEIRGQLWRQMWAETEAGNLAYATLTESFYPTIEQFVQRHARFDDAAFADELRSTGVLLVVNALAEVAVDDAVDDATLGQYLLDTVTESVRHFILSRTRKILKSSGYVSLDAPFIPKESAPTWLERVSSQMVLEQLGWAPDEHLQHLADSQLIEPSMLADSPLVEVRLSSTLAVIVSALQKNSLLAAIERRDQRSVDAAQALLRRIAEHLDLYQIHEPTGHVNLFDLLHACASSGIAFEEVYFQRQQPRLWRALHSVVASQNPEHKVISQLKAAASEIDEIG